MGVRKSEKQAGGRARQRGRSGREWSGSGPSAGALVLALMAQRRVGVAVVMMGDAAEGKGDFSVAFAAAAARPAALAGWRLAPRALLAPLLSPERLRLRLRGAQAASQTTSGETRRPDLPSSPG